VLSVPLPNLGLEAVPRGAPDREETRVNDTIVTLQGWVGGPVALRKAGDALVATFRLGSTPRHYRRDTDQWVDDQTQWFTVSAWRRLGEHCEVSLKRGDAVIVHGRMRLSTWVDANGVERETWEIVATTVGHDLTRGTSTFVKPERATQAVPAGEDVAPTTPDQEAAA
jgi:single-strand DNA-binding protein